MFEVRKMHTKKLGKNKFEPAPPAVLLSDQLPNHLRALESITSPVLDLIQDFQRRNIVEVRKKQVASKIAKRNKKSVIKKSWKRADQEDELAKK